MKRYYETHKEEIKLYQETHKEEIAEKIKPWMIVHSQERAECCKRWAIVHPRRIVAIRMKYLRTPKGRDSAHRSYTSRRARKHDALVEDFTDPEIYGRDRWICGSPDCPVPGRKVNPKLKYPHPFSASIDEIIPYSLGGKRERKNCQLMHLRCNLKKFTKSIGCQLRVFG